MESQRDGGKGGGHSQRDRFAAGGLGKEPKGPPLGQKTGTTEEGRKSSEGIKRNKVPKGLIVKKGKKFGKK